MQLGPSLGGMPLAASTPRPPPLSARCGNVYMAMASKFKNPLLQLEQGGGGNINNNGGGNNGNWGWNRGGNGGGDGGSFNSGLMFQTPWCKKKEDKETQIFPTNELKDIMQIRDFKQFVKNNKKNLTPEQLAFYLKMQNKLQELIHLVEEETDWMPMVDDRNEDIKIETRWSKNGLPTVRSQGHIKGDPQTIWRCINSGNTKTDWANGMSFLEKIGPVGYTLHNKSIRILIIEPRSFLIDMITF